MKQKPNFEERLIASVCHLAQLIALGVIWIPLFVLLLRRENDFIKSHAKFALIYQSVSLAFMWMVAYAGVYASFPYTLHALWGLVIGAGLLAVVGLFRASSGR